MSHREMLGIVAKWPRELFDLWDERAALIEDGCKVGREESEARAFDQLKHKAPPVQRILLEVGR